MLEKTFQYNQQEFVKAYRYVLLYSGAFSKVDYVLFPLCLVGAWFIPYLVPAILSGIIGIMGIFGVFYQLYIIPGKLFKKDITYREKYFLQFDERGFVLNNFNQDRTYMYQQFDKIIVNDEFLFFLEGKSAVFIPLRIFKNNEWQVLKNEITGQKDILMKGRLNEK